MWWRRIRYTLALIALCALATCPTARRSCIAQQRAREADQLLGELADKVADIVWTTGHVPPVGAGPSPQASCCDQGGTCSPDAATWEAPGWRALGFTIDGDYRYTYEYAPDASGLGATLRATADLACDGQPSRYELRLVVKDRRVERTWTRKDATD
jgi:hypothetical protein